jgi:hypothetical protein
VGSSGRNLGPWGHTLEGDIVTLSSLSLFPSTTRWAALLHHDIPSHHQPQNNSHWAWTDTSETMSQNNCSSFSPVYLMNLVPKMEDWLNPCFPVISPGTSIATNVFPVAQLRTLITFLILKIPFYKKERFFATTYCPPVRAEVARVYMASECGQPLSVITTWVNGKVLLMRKDNCVIGPKKAANQILKLFSLTKQTQLSMVSYCNLKLMLQDLTEY